MNNTIKTAGKISNIFGGLSFLLTGLVILGISIFVCLNYHDLDGKTNAIIVDIQKELIDVFTDDNDLYPEEQYDYKVFIDYSVDGQEYKHVQYDSYDSSMKVGQEIEIQYDTKDPSNIQSTNSKTFIYAFIVIGALASTFGVFRTVKSVKSDKENPMYAVMKD